MKTYLWKIDKKKLNKTNLAEYSDFIKKNYKVHSDNDFNKIWKWSINNTKVFWKSIWDFTKVKGNLGNTLLDESSIFFKNKFFPDTNLNYAQNLLKKILDASNRVFPKLPFTFVKSHIDFQKIFGLSTDHFQILLKSLPELTLYFFLIKLEYRAKFVFFCFSLLIFQR
jgi:hypothetical protein